MPRIRRQRDYRLGDRVEVLANEADICRSWYAGVIVDCFGPDGRSTVYDRQGRKRKKPKRSPPAADDAVKNRHSRYEQREPERTQSRDAEEEQEEQQQTRSKDHTRNGMDAMEMGDEFNLIHDDYDPTAEKRERSPCTVRSPPGDAHLHQAHHSHERRPPPQQQQQPQQQRHDSNHKHRRKRPRDSRSLYDDDNESASSNSDEEDKERLNPSFLNSLLGGMAYAVRMTHMPQDHVEEVELWRMRPAPPTVEPTPSRPDVGEAVEALREDGAWVVGVVHSFVVRKGLLIAFENGDTKWLRAPGVRPYQVWRGGAEWVRKLKPPLPLVKKAIGLCVTHPPGGKRRRSCQHVLTTPFNYYHARPGEDEDNKVDRSHADSHDHPPLLGSREATLRQYGLRVSKRKRAAVDSSGPGGLPDGWRVERSGETRLTCYVAPDGHRLATLKEAQLYVRLMGPT